MVLRTNIQNSGNRGCKRRRDRTSKLDSIIINLSSQTDDKKNTDGKLTKAASAKD